MGVFFFMDFPLMLMVSPSALGLYAKGCPAVMGRTALKRECLALFLELQGLIVLMGPVPKYSVPVFPLTAFEMLNCMELNSSTNLLVCNKYGRNILVCLTCVLRETMWSTRSRDTQRFKSPFGHEAHWVILGQRVSAILSFLTGLL